jgi:GntR family transcriptional regulator / MocR family aminotransferase
MRACYRSRRDRLVAMLAARAPDVTPVGISAGLRVLPELPPTGPSAQELTERAAQRAIELFPVTPHHHDGRAARNAVVVGYGALPEHDFEAGVGALGDLLATSLEA